MVGLYFFSLFFFWGGGGGGCGFLCFALFCVLFLSISVVRGDLPCLPLWWKFDGINLFPADGTSNGIIKEALSRDC